MPVRPNVIVLKSLKEREKVVRSNPGASLLDIGDGVLCLEFHSPNQAIGPDILDMMEIGVREMETNFAGMVIGNQAKNFCVGANLMMILMEAQDDNWEEIDSILKRFQDAALALKYSSKPVVAAPFGMTLGGGAEICLHANSIRAAGETYMGLVEVGVGLIPGGGGHKELLIRHIEGVPDDKIDLQPYVNRTFETIAMAKVATSGKEAQRLSLLRSTDQITASLDYLIYDAKQTVLAMNLTGFQPPRPKKIRVVGESGLALLKYALWSMHKSGYISEHDVKVGSKVAYVLCGGNVPSNTLVTEQYLLDIEREAFLSLCGEPKSQERMQHMLTKGKPLRN